MAEALLSPAAICVSTPISSAWARGMQSSQQFPCRKIFVAKHALPDIIRERPLSLLPDIRQGQAADFCCAASVIRAERSLAGSQRRILGQQGVRCQAVGGEGDAPLAETGGGKPPAVPGGLDIGSPIVIVAPPPFVKSAEPMPMLRENKGQIKEGDVGRIMDRRPKGVWAIRFANGAYLVDRKYFKELDL